MYKPSNQPNNPQLKGPYYGYLHDLMFKKPEPESDNDSQDPPSQATLCGVCQFFILVFQCCTKV